MKMAQPEARSRHTGISNTDSYGYSDEKPPMMAEGKQVSTKNSWKGKQGKKQRKSQYTPVCQFQRKKIGGWITGGYFGRFFCKWKLKES